MCGLRQTPMSELTSRSHTSRRVPGSTPGHAVIRTVCSARAVPRIVQLACDAAADDAKRPLGLQGTLEVSNSAANLVHGNAHVIPEHNRRQARHQTAEFSRLSCIKPVHPAVLAGRAAQARTA